MERNYKIVRLHLAWGEQSDNPIGHAIVAARLSCASYHMNIGLTPYSSYEEYKKECKSHGIYSVVEERFNEYMLIIPIS